MISRFFVLLFGDGKDLCAESKKLLKFSFSNNMRAIFLPDEAPKPEFSSAK
jgi:hypothetical protein